MYFFRMIVSFAVSSANYLDLDVHPKQCPRGVTRILGAR